MNSVYCLKLLQTLSGITMRFVRLVKYCGMAVVAVAVSMGISYANNQSSSIRPANNELGCMALNIYHESKNQSKLGMIAVARVVVNRMNDKRFPDNVCDVIYEGPSKQSWKDPNKMVMVRNRCQFSWYCDGKSDEIPNKDNNIAWRLAQDVAVEVLVLDKYVGVVEGATHYHADYVDPAWNKSITLVTKVDDHIFYRWD